jgi:hypothetical protein
MSEDTMPARVGALWAASGAVAVALFGCGLLFGDLLATTNFPALDATPVQLREYFLRNVSDVRALTAPHPLQARTKQTRELPRRPQDIHQIVADRRAPSSLEAAARSAWLRS